MEERNPLPLQPGAQSRSRPQAALQRIEERAEACLSTAARPREILISGQVHGSTAAEQLPAGDQMSQVARVKRAFCCWQGRAVSPQLEAKPSWATRNIASECEPSGRGSCIGQ